MCNTGYSVDRRHLIRFQIETTIFKFLRRHDCLPYQQDTLVEYLNTLDSPDRGLGAQKSENKRTAKQKIQGFLSA